MRSLVEKTSVYLNHFQRFDFFSVTIQGKHTIGMFIFPDRENTHTQTHKMLFAHRDNFDVLKIK